MKKLRKTALVLSSIAVSSVLIALGCNSLNGGKRHALKENGKILCEIVVPDEAGPVAKFAGKEMKDFLSKSLGGEIQILKSPSGQKTAIILGNSKEARDAGIDISKLASDGFVIKTCGNNIIIAGRDNMKINPETAINGGIWAMHFERGTVFGAYEFLERFAGIRFYFPGELGTIIPKHKNLVITYTDIYEKPDFTKRSVSNLGQGSGKIDWMPEQKSLFTLKNLMDLRAYRLETEYIPCCHGLSSRGYVERFGKTHPEYFALMKDGKRCIYMQMGQHDFSGQLCLNSGIREEIYKDAEAFLTGKSAKERGITTKYGVIWDPSSTQPYHFDLMPQDGFYKCNCEKCQAYFEKGDQATSDLVWGLVAEVANKLKAKGIPGYVTMMAYSPYKAVPSIELPDNVKVMIATGGPWYRPIYKTQLENILAWNKKMGGDKRTWLWNYSCKFSKLKIPSIPASTPRATAEFYKMVSPYVFGAFLETNAEDESAANYLYNYLNHYVFGKVAWKNSTDVDALLKEHHRLMFGAAAPQMEKVFNAFEDNWLRIVGKPIETPLGPQMVPLSDYDIFEKVYSENEMKRLKGLFDASEKITANDPDSNKRVKFIRERFLDPILKTRERYLEDQKAINDLRFHVKALPSGEKLSIDGKIDDPAWKNASRITLVPHMSEKNKKDIGMTTSVMALRDTENLYIAFDCEEPEMDKLSSSKRKSDDREIWQDSSVEIFLNPSADRNKYYQILVNADGTVSDLSNSKEKGRTGIDWSWNSGTSAASFKGPKSWTVEIAIPLKNLEGLDPDKDFPANFTRSRILNKKNSDHASLFTWSPFLKNGFHDIDNFGYITFKGTNSPNVIKNGMFNAPLKKGNRQEGWGFAWKLPPFEKWEIVNDPFTESGRCLMMQRKSSEKGAFRATQSLPELKPDTDYQLSYCVRIEGLSLLPGSRACGIVVNIWDDKNTWWPKNFYTSDMPWTRQGFKFRTGPNTNKPPHKSYVMLTIMDAACTAYFGDVKLSEIQKD